MNLTSRLLLLVCLCLSLIAGSATPVLATIPELAVPAGFYEISSAQGVTLYRKDYQGGSPDFVQRVNLLQGASVGLFHGDITEKREGKGSYEGPDPRIALQSLDNFWTQAQTQNANAFCVLNGQFFLMRESPTRLPFPLKIDGEIISDGYGKDEHVDEKLFLELWHDRADIRVLDHQSLYNSTAPNIVAGLREDGRKSPTKYVPRTFVGIEDQDGNGTFETILIFNSRSARQKDAAGVLQEFGAEKVMMLDGGGSTQLLCRGQSYITSDRRIPQALAIFSGEGVNLVAQQEPPLVEDGVEDTNMSHAGLFSFQINPGQQTTTHVQGETELLHWSDLQWILYPILVGALVMLIAINRSKQHY